MDLDMRSIADHADPGPKRAAADQAYSLGNRAPGGRWSPLAVRLAMLRGLGAAPRGSRS